MSPSGQLKLADFGLARPLAPLEQDADPSALEAGSAMTSLAATGLEPSLAAGAAASGPAPREQGVAVPGPLGGPLADPPSTGLPLPAAAPTTEVPREPFESGDMSHQVTTLLLNMLKNVNACPLFFLPNS